MKKIYKNKAKQWHWNQSTVVAINLLKSEDYIFKNVECSSQDDSRSPLKKSWPQNEMTPELAQVLDRTKTRNRAAAHIISAALTCFGWDVEYIYINKNSIGRNKQNYRENTAGS